MVRTMLLVVLAVAIATLGSVTEATAAGPFGVPDRVAGAPNGADLPAVFTQWARVWWKTYQRSEPAGNRLMLLDDWYTWLSVQEIRVANGEQWYRTSTGRWVDAENMRIMPVTKFAGYHLQGVEQGQLAFVLADETRVVDSPNANGGTITRLARYTPVGVLGVDGGWARIAPGWWVPTSTVRMVKPVARPNGVGVDDKWIDVNLTQQTVAAYEGDKLVFATLTSTGKEETPTVTGLFHVYEKRISEFMAGGWAEKDPYILEEVPWTMYFEQRYALHGAYWHDEFGEVQSRGCVNLSPVDAKFLFTWSGPVVPVGQTRVFASPENPGTWVYVHK
jgi:hypothetical protein